MKRPITPPNLPSHVGLELQAWTRRASSTLNTELVGPPIVSNTSIAPSHPIHHVTGTAAIATILVPPGSTGPLRLIVDAAWTLIAGGNIAAAVTPTVGHVVALTYDPATGFWYPT